MELIQERNTVLKQIFGNYIPKNQITLRCYQAPKYYLTERQAQQIIFAQIKSKPFTAKKPKSDNYRQSEIKKRLQNSLTNQYLKILSENPKIKKADLFFQVVNSPAPEFFISLRTLKKILKKN